MPGKSSDQFKAGDLVFAKMKGFPHWPARVPKRIPVFFFGTHQIFLKSSLPPENVVPYIGNKMKYGSGVRIKGFAEGMWEIQNTPGVGSKLKVTTPVKSASTSKITPAKSGSTTETTPAKSGSTSKATPAKTSNDMRRSSSAPRKPEHDSKPAAETETPAKTATRASSRLAPDKTTESKQTFTDVTETAVTARSRRAASRGSAGASAGSAEDRKEVRT
uniref:PWWP domain-containing protein n=1 Tax=Amphiprion percula TaxID=161767 RepID=A0A3P8TJ19_AMPPE